MNIAILIDAENVLPGHADLIFDYAKSMGTVIYKEIFGAAAALSAWVAPVLKYAMHANLTIKAAKGKNSSDIALVIGAMDLLVAGGIDAVIIASSDSDFSALSVRLRNAGIEVIGMGTEKANELWRTACSSFVVLQAAKPAAKTPSRSAARAAQAHAQPARQEPAEAPAPQPEKPKAPAKKAARSAAPTHEARVEVISQLIAKRLAGHDRVLVSTLFPALNKLPEYQTDRQGSGKKPLNYLTSTFGEVFHFEDAPDGNSWVSLTGEGAPAEAPAAEAEAPEAVADEVDEVVEALPAEAEPVEAVEAAEAPAAEEEPEAEPEAVPEEEPGDAPEEESPEGVELVQAEPEETEVPAGMVELLVNGGMAEDIAQGVAEVFAGSTSLRSAYNKLRSIYGGTAGREYYQQAKEIAENAGR